MSEKSSLLYTFLHFSTHIHMHASVFVCAFSCTEKGRTEFHLIVRVRGCFSAVLKSMDYRSMDTAALEGMLLNRIQELEQQVILIFFFFKVLILCLLPDFVFRSI